MKTRILHEHEILTTISLSGWHGKIQIEMPYVDVFIFNS